MPSKSTSPPPPLFYPSSSSSSFIITGAHPMSRLDVGNNKLPLDVSVYAYPRYRLNDMNTSATPAVAFTAVIHNPLSKSVNASFLFNLPLGMEPNTQRVQPQMTPPSTRSTLNSFLGQCQVTSQLDCFHQCNNMNFCMSWSYDATNQMCLLFNDVQLNGFKNGSHSGVKVIMYA